MTSGEPVETKAVNSGQLIQHIIEGNDKYGDRRVKVAVGWNSWFSGSLSLFPSAVASENLNWEWRWMVILITFFIAVIKHLKRGKLKKGFFSLQYEGIQLIVYEEASHIASVYSQEVQHS